jgi:Fn3-like domain
MLISPKRLLFFVSLFSLFLFSVSLASAQTDGGLRLITSPLPINLVTEPGTTVTTELKVKNGGTQTETLKISLMKFSAYEDSGKPKLMDPEPQDDFLKWVTFSDPTFTVGPNEWKTVTATFNVPTTASFGYYYAFVFSRAQDTQALQAGQTAIVGGTATLVLLEARTPDAKREITVSEFSVDKQFYEFLPATFNIKLKNTGNVHIAPRGNIFIDQGDTHDLAILEVNSEKGNILPNSNRIFNASWTDGFPVYTEKTEDGKTVLNEQGQTEYTLKWNWQDASKLRFGKYTAKLLLIYDDGHRDVPIEGEVSFWVVPWRLALYVIIIISIPALIVYLFMKWRMRKMRRTIKK